MCPTCRGAVVEQLAPEPAALAAELGVAVEIVDRQLAHAGEQLGQRAGIQIDQRELLDRAFLDGDEGVSQGVEAGRFRARRSRHQLRPTGRAAGW